MATLTKHFDFGEHRTAMKKAFDTMPDTGVITARQIAAITGDHVASVNSALAGLRKYGLAEAGKMRGKGGEYVWTKRKFISKPQAPLTGKRTRSIKTLNPLHQTSGMAGSIVPTQEPLPLDRKNPDDLKSVLDDVHAAFNILTDEIHRLTTLVKVYESDHEIMERARRQVSHHDVQH